MNFKKAILVFAGFASFAWGQRVTVEVPANRAWTRTGIYIDPGSSVLIEATGQIEAVSSADTRPLFHRVPPEGRAERQENKPQPAMRALAMLGRIGNGPVFEAGARTELAADPKRSGELQLGINDNNVDDNTGSWTAQVTVRAGTTTTTSQDRQQGQQQDNGANRGGPASQDRGNNSNTGARAGGNSPNSQDRNAGNQPNPDRGVNPSPGYRADNNSPNYQDRGGAQYSEQDRNRYRGDEQYRPNYRDSDYYRRYGHGFAVDEAVRICQQSVSTQALRRFRTNDIHFNRTAIDDNPGRNDWVTGTLDVHRGQRGERFGFSCSVDFNSGQVRSAVLDARPLPDDPRYR